MPYVFSTLTNANEFAEWVKAGDQQSIQRTVRIEGGHGVMNKNFLTPQGVATEVSDDELAFLMQNDAFKKHMEDGFISVDAKKVDSEKKASNMKTRDGSAPIVPSDYAKGGMMDGIKEPTVTGVQ